MTKSLNPKATVQTNPLSVLDPSDRTDQTDKGMIPPNGIPELAQRESMCGGCCGQIKVGTEIDWLYRNLDIQRHLGC